MRSPRPKPSPASPSSLLSPAEHLLLADEKMSKSLGNTFTLREMMARGYHPDAIRYLLSSVPYRKKLNFTFEALDAAANAIERCAL
jgi:cysteinyl-tRNA synthetase